MKKVMMSVIAVTLLLASSVWSEEVIYRTHIKPVFDSKCLACHSVNSAPEYYAFKEEQAKWISMGQGMRMDTYSHLIFYTAWPDTGSLMRRLDDGKNTKDAKPGNMYKYLGRDEDERQKNLKLFKDWVGNWVLKRWADITKEDMNGIKVKY